jgi:uncharacterized membrane protein YphA (DoxX/SURF4 family)
MGTVLLAFVVGLAVAAAVFLGITLYTWTAIHSGWSDFGIEVFFASMWIAPLVLGTGAGAWTYRTLRKRAGHVPRSS